MAAQPEPMHTRPRLDDALEYLDEVRSLSLPSDGRNNETCRHSVSWQFDNHVACYSSMPPDCLQSAPASPLGSVHAGQSTVCGPTPHPRQVFEDPEGF
jgi:hypothetical protein